MPVNALTKIGIIASSAVIACNFGFNKHALADLIPTAYYQEELEAVTNGTVSFGINYDTLVPIPTNTNLPITNFTPTEITISAPDTLYYGSSFAQVGAIAGLVLTPVGTSATLGPQIFTPATTAQIGVVQGPFAGFLNTATPTPPATAPSLYLTVSPGAEGGVFSLSGQPTDIIASAVIATTPPPNSVKLQLPISLPAGTTTIQQAVTALGYTSLDWAQFITVPQPSDFYECTDIQCSSTQIIGGTYSDPPIYGYNYCNINSKTFEGELDCSEAYPYYYSLADAEDNPCILVLGVGNCGLHLISPDGTTLNFYDLPADPVASASNPLGFITQLVGIPENGGQDVVLANFDWIDTFDGLSGGIATTFNTMAADPGSGTGGITLISINGVPVGSGGPVGVPEPGALSLLCAGLVAFGLLSVRF